MDRRRLFLLVCASIAAVGCGGSGGSTGDTTPPTATATPSSGAFLASSTAPVTIRFSESMDRASLTLAGALGDAAVATWSTTSATDDTLTLTPTGASWPAGPWQELRIDADDLAGNALATLSATYQVAAGAFYYVNGQATDDTGDGLSPATAKKTIQAAIDLAVVTATADAPASVLVAEGQYAPASAVALRANVSLYGGFDAAFSTRDTSAHASEIVGTGLPSGITVTAGEAMGGETVLDGFTVTGGDDLEWARAVTLGENAVATVRGCTIVGGSDPNGSTAVLAYGSWIDGNTLRAGPGTRASALLSYSGLVTNNVAFGGPGTASFAVGVGLGAKVVGNTVHGGTGPTSVGISQSTFPGSSGVIENNLIDMSSTPPPGQSSGPQCISVRSNAGVSVRNNDLFGCATLVAAGLDPYVEYTDLDSVNSSTLFTASGNVSIDPAFADAASEDFHLTAGSPAAVTRGGLDRSDLGAMGDRDGVLRTAPWSIGAYERD